MKIFATGNQQFGRKGAIKKFKRPFSNVQEMNNHMIDAWNSVVNEGDQVYVLGNLAWDPITARKVLKKLKGQIWFLRGSHDAALEEVIEDFPNVQFFNDAIMELPDFDTVICHYPLSVWNGKDSGTIHIHGHTVLDHKTDLTIENRFNICTDFWGYSPINYLTLKDFING